MPGPGLAIVPTLRVELSTAVVATVELLALPGPELERELRAAADANPALVVREQQACGRCGRWATGCGCGIGGAVRPVDEAAAVVSAWEQLRRDLLAAVPARLAPLALATLAALDDRGLLDPAALRDVRPADRAGVLAALRAVGPPGIGATSVAECLVMQLDGAPLSAAERALSHTVLTEHAALLAEQGAAAVADALGCDPARLAALLKRLARLLRPYPGLGEPSGAAPPPAADLIFTRDGDAVRVVVVERERWSVEVDEGYRRAGPQRDALREQWREARAFAERVHLRWALLVRLGELLATEHATELLAGSTAFQPLTQAAAAARLGVHESTVSRAVRHRSARLVDGRVVALRALFGTNHALKAAVAELVRADPRLSDRAVAEALTARGMPLARRTVAKYRSTLAD